MTRLATAGPPQEVRIIGGQWKRRKLAVHNAPGLRPTPDRVRVTLFNWLGQDLTGVRCLDAFAGSGALAFEAASRGATNVVALELDRAAARALHASRERLVAASVTVLCADALAWMSRAPAASFDLVFIDPPFASGLTDRALPLAARVVSTTGLIYLEAPRAAEPKALAELGLVIHRQAKAGAVHYHLLRRLAAAVPGPTLVAPESVEPTA